MNTCQTSIKDRYIIIVLLKPPSWVLPGYQTIRDHHIGSSTELMKVCACQADKH